MPEDAPFAHPALRSLGVRVCLWQLPYIPNGSRLYEELLAVDLDVHERGRSHAG